MTGLLLKSISIKFISQTFSCLVVEMNSTLGRARREDLFCSSLWIGLILVAIAVKSHCFCQPDGISITFLEQDVYCTENCIYMFIVVCDKTSREICLPEEKEFFIFIVAYVWRCREMSRTHRIKHTRFV